VLIAELLMAFVWMTAVVATAPPVNKQLTLTSYYAALSVSVLQ